ncbi:MAG: hypothetical protein J6U24_01835 [Paludibacteraceae bacterium]|nr:hypothetical protein [Paludibacteraceae bacterium]
MKNLIFITTALSALLLSGCNNKVENTSVPYAAVDFDIDTSISGSDNKLRDGMTGNYRVYSTKFPAACSAGHGKYGVSGVVVVRAMDNTLYAFDMCCPHEAQKDIVLEMDGFFAKCKNCESLFEVGNGTGGVNSGPSKQPLKSYSVYRLSSETYRVTN